MKAKFVKESLHNIPTREQILDDLHYISDMHAIEKEQPEEWKPIEEAINRLGISEEQAGAFFGYGASLEKEEIINFLIAKKINFVEFDTFDEDWGIICDLNDFMVLKKIQ